VGCNVHPADAHDDEQRSGHDPPPAPQVGRHGNGEGGGNGSVPLRKAQAAGCEGLPGLDWIDQGLGPAAFSYFFDHFRKQIDADTGNRHGERQARAPHEQSDERQKVFVAINSWPQGPPRAASEAQLFRTRLPRTSADLASRVALTARHQALGIAQLAGIPSCHWLTCDRFRVRSLRVESGTGTASGSVNLAWHPVAWLVAWRRSCADQGPSTNKGDQIAGLKTKRLL
jgi:hypothetical protein